jgi:hypothetical protein
MPNELNIALAQSQTGLAVTAQLYQNRVAVGSPISLTEVGSTAYYTGHMSGTAGDYQLLFRASGENVGSGSIRWDGSAEILPATGGSIPSATGIATQVRTELSPELAKVSALNTTRLAQVSTVETTGAQIAAALS